MVRMRGGHFRLQFQRRLRDARVLVSGTILFLVMPVGHLLGYLPANSCFRRTPQPSGPKRGTVGIKAANESSSLALISGAPQGCTGYGFFD